MREPYEDIYFIFDLFNFGVDLYVYLGLSI
jgi:hypothetical protein